MKTRSHKLMSLLLALTLILSLLPGTALAVDDIPINGPSSIEINGSGTYSMPTNVSGMTVSYKSYQWVVDGENAKYISISGSKTSPTCKVTGKSAGVAYLYCFTTDALGTQRRSRIAINVKRAPGTTSDGATMTVTASPMTVYVGDTFTTTATITNTTQSNFEYRWSRNANPEYAVVGRGDSEDSSRSSVCTWEARQPGTATLICMAAQNLSSSGEMLSNSVTVRILEKEEEKPEISKPSQVPTPSPTIWSQLSIDVSKAQSGDTVSWSSNCGLLFSASSNGSGSGSTATTNVSNGRSIVWFRMSENTAKAAKATTGNIRASVMRDGKAIATTDISVTLPDSNPSTNPGLRFTNSTGSSLSTVNVSGANGRTEVYARDIASSGEQIVWTVEDNSVARIYNASTEGSQDARKEVITTASTFTGYPAVVVLGVKAGETTLTAQVIDRSENKIGSAVEIPITVGGSTPTVVPTLSVDSKYLTVEAGKTVEQIIRLGNTSGITSGDRVGVSYFTTATGNSSAFQHIKITQGSTNIAYATCAVIEGLSAGEETVYAQVSYNGTLVGDRVSFTVTVTGDTGLTLSDGLNLSNTSTANSYGTITASIPTTMEGNRGEYSVRWTSSNANIAYFSTKDSTNTSGSAAETIFGSTASGSTYTSPITIYAGKTSGTATITAQLYRGSTRVGTAVTRTVRVNQTGFTISATGSNTSSNSSRVTLSYDSNRYDSSATFRISGVSGNLNGQTVNSNNFTNLSYAWSLRRNTSSSSSENYGTSSSCTVSARNLTYATYVLTCTVTARYNGQTATDTVSWTITNYDYGTTSDFTVSATVEASSKGYYLGDKDDNNGSSIISQIRSKLGSSRELDYVIFDDVTDTYGDLMEGNSTASRRESYYYNYRSSSSRSDLADVYFEPASSGKTGTATFDCTVYDDSRNSYDCTINIKVVSDGKGGSGDINYTAKAGADVDFDSDDFEDWWEDNYSRGTLDYVEFTSASNGTLYADYNGSKGTEVVSSRSPESCYVKPSSRQTGIDDLTFVPRSSSTTSATIKFTAYGTTSSTSTRNSSLSGTVSIDFGTSSSSTAKDITYSTTGTKGVSLTASDFTSRYRDVVGSSASTLTIRFTSVPSSGTLTYEPSSGRDVTLTSSNIKNYDFSSSSSGTYRISDVVYTPKSNTNITSDRVKYDCYSGSRLRFSGTIVFSSKAENTNTVVSGVTVSYSTTGASVTFNAADFYNKNSAMLSASYLVFGTPSSGTLSVGSTAVSSGTKFGYVANAASGYQHIGSLSYRPAANFNGTATISFTAYNANDTQAATGTVTILVANQTTTPPTTPSTTTTFSDVPNTASTSWYYNELTALAAQGIVAGRNDGLFHPSDAVNYGEALKLILLASGYPKQTELSGAAWASNYLNLAITNGILSGSASDYTLGSSINRDAVAEAAAKALKLTPVTTGTSPYADSNNGYVRALTDAGIVQGDASSGTTRWRGSDTLTRAEVTKIVYNVYRYRNVAPGSTTTTPTVDTNKPGWLN